ncbi:hypothetical protein C8Q77DRAFT_626534 [Trametes polyzona]|nr:hypothetical protein C8Q77DRAFT_626534 [Trametes polyzona]
MWHRETMCAKLLVESGRSTDVSVSQDRPTLGKWRHRISWVRKLWTIQQDPGQIHSSNGSVSLTRTSAKGHTQMVHSGRYCSTTPQRTSADGADKRDNLVFVTNRAEMRSARYPPSLVPLSVQQNIRRLRPSAGERHDLHHTVSVSCARLLNCSCSAQVQPISCALLVPNHLPATDIINATGINATNQWIRPNSIAPAPYPSHYASGMRPGET